MSQKKRRRQASESAETTETTETTQTTNMYQPSKSIRKKGTGCGCSKKTSK